MHGGLPGLPPGGHLPGIFPRGNLLQFYFDPSDLSVRAMCHHQMGKTKEAALCLRMTRRILSKEAEIAADIARSVGSAMPVGSSEQWALLREAETLIEGNKK